MRSLRSLIASSLLLPAVFLTGCPSDRAPTASTPKAPAQVPVAEPEPAPAEEKPFDRGSLKTPWKLAKVGDYAVYKLYPPINRTFRFEVVDVTERTVTCVRKDADTGMTIDTMKFDLEKEEERYKDPMTYDALARDEMDNEITPFWKDVEVAGKKLRVLVVKRAREDMGSTEMWLAEEDVRPFMQCTVKSLRNEKLMHELIDFGTAR